MPITTKKPVKRRKYSSIRQLSRPDEWALGMGLKVDGKPFSLVGREYVRQVIRDLSQEIVIPKAAQMAFTVTFLVRTAHWIVQRKWNHLYLLPVKTGAIPFVQARIDPIIESNAVLAKEFSTVDNRLHKQSIARINWYIRGTNINRELQEIPVDVEVWDERDRMVEENLDDARRRMDGSKVKKLTMLSTPTAPGHGVDADDAWHASDQHRWEVPCPHCGKSQVFNFEENVKLGDTAEECEFVCQFCRKPITDEERWMLNALGRWTPFNLDGRLRGYHINQFNSPTQGIENIMRGWFKGQSDSKALKSFMNGALGIPYVAEGDQFTEQILDGCRSKAVKLGGIPNGTVFVGVDVGAVLHVRADVLTPAGQRIAWAYKIFRTWGQLDDFLDGLVSFNCVIDAHPEKTMARDLSIKYTGRVWLGFELDRDQSGEMAIWSKAVHGDSSKVAIDRTMAFDTLIKRYIDGRIHIPANARDLGEEIETRNYNGYYYQMMQMVGEEEENTKGILVRRWKKNRNKDHWHHADMFCEIACMKSPGLIIPSGIGDVLRAAGGLHHA